MDRDDFRILLELHRHPFASNEAIGKATDISGTTVKTRLTRLRSRGVIRGYYVLLPAKLFHRFHRIAAYFDVDPEPEMGTALAISDVVNVWRGAPRMFNLNLYTPTADSRPSREFEQVFGRPPDAWVHPEPPSDSDLASDELSPLDWRVIDALLDAPRGSLGQLADRTGLTARTVRRHRDHLAETERLEVFPILDASRESGSIAYSGYIGVRDRSILSRIQLPDLSYARPHHEPPALSVVGFAESYGEVMQIERRIRLLPGVTYTVLTVARGGGAATERLHEWVARELSKWKAASGRPADHGRRSLRPAPTTRR